MPVIYVRGSKAYQALWWRANRYIHPFFDPCEQPHPHVVVDGIELDEGIADLVRWVWSIGVTTHNSCQGDPVLETLCDAAQIATANPHTASITFGQLNDARWFASALRTVVPERRLGGTADRIFITFDPMGDANAQEYFHVAFSSKVLLRGDLVQVLDEMVSER